jgi:Tol biopolymer transport system component
MFNDGDPVLSPDGCELYFSSKRERAHLDYDLYVAKVTTRPVQR